MIRSAKDLEKHSLQARDGEIGKVKGLYFDEQEWNLRYLVVETGSFFNSRKVLISPSSILGSEWLNETVNVDLTREQIRNSPEIDTEQRVVRRQELALNDYYGWPLYWGAPMYGGAPMIIGGGAIPVHPMPVEVNPREERSAVDLDRSALRTTHEAMGYDIEATDGSIGHAEDFLFDDQSWQISHLVIDTRNWWPGKKVLVSPLWISDIQWDAARVVMDLTREAIKASPEYDPSAPLGPDYIDRLHGHYGKDRYDWKEADGRGDVSS